jgi:hypothetical protein
MAQPIYLASGWVTVLKYHILAFLLAICCSTSAAGQKDPWQQAGIDDHRGHPTTSFHAKGIDNGIRMTAPLDDWVLTQSSFYIQYYVDVSSVEPDLLSPGLTCKTKAFLDDEALFSLELSQEDAYTASSEVFMQLGMSSPSSFFILD